jgi:hypothetical protein
LAGGDGEGGDGDGSVVGEAVDSVGPTPVDIVSLPPPHKIFPPHTGSPIGFGTGGARP